jgi:hypothetical protein
MFILAYFGKTNSYARHLHGGIWRYRETIKQRNKYKNIYSLETKITK